MNTSDWIFELNFNHEKFSEFVATSQMECSNTLQQLDELDAKLKDVTDKDEEHLHGFKDLLLLQYNECLVQTFSQRAPINILNKILGEISF